MEIKYPIFYVDGGGVILFHSVGEIEQFLEPWAITEGFNEVFEENLTDVYNY